MTSKYRKLTSFGFGLACLTLSIGARANTLVESTFDVNDEGWRVGEFFNTVGNNVPSYFAAGGNPDGFIQTIDLFSWTAFHAPAAFLGDQSAAYGGTLHLDERILSSDAINYPMVVIASGPLILQFRTTPPNTTWTSFDIPLLASAGWEVSPETGDPGLAATEAQLQSVLTSLDFLNIDADWLTGGDQVGLDNVRLSSATAALPEGGSFTPIYALLAAILFGVSRRASR